MEREEVACFTSLLWATDWSVESECCAHAYVLACSLVVTENWTRLTMYFLKESSLYYSDLNINYKFIYISVIHYILL
jgi:hypothetical protein